MADIVELYPDRSLENKLGEQLLADNELELPVLSKPMALWTATERFSMNVVTLKLLMALNIRDRKGVTYDALVKRVFAEEIYRVLPRYLLKALLSQLKRSGVLP
jgi:hypothetical protein